MIRMELTDKSSVEDKLFRGSAQARCDRKRRDSALRKLKYSHKYANDG